MSVHGHNFMHTTLHCTTLSHLTPQSAFLSLSFVIMILNICVHNETLLDLFRSTLLFWIIWVFFCQTLIAIVVLFLPYPPTSTFLWTWTWRFLPTFHTTHKLFHTHLSSNLRGLGYGTTLLHSISFLHVGTLTHTVLCVCIM